MTHTETYKRGTRIFYTGDQANRSSYGTIITYRPRTKYHPESVDIAYDEPRFDGDDRKASRQLPVLMFNPSPGQRFFLADDYDRERKEKLAQLYARHGKTEP